MIVIETNEHMKEKNTWKVRKVEEEWKEEEKWESKSTWMPCAAAEWHFIGIYQLSSDWPDIANPSRCSALTDECVTVSRGKKTGRGGLRLPAHGKQGLSGTTVCGIWGDLEDRMIQHPGNRWHRVHIVSTIWDIGCTRDFPFPHLHFRDVCLLTASFQPYP